MKMRSLDSEKKHICPEVRMLCSDRICLVPVKKVMEEEEAIQPFKAGPGEQEGMLRGLAF